MSDRALVINGATGVIHRTLLAPPEMLALNVSAGEALFVIVGDDGLHFDDGIVLVGESGSLELAAGAPEGATAPTYELAYVAI